MKARLVIAALTSVLAIGGTAWGQSAPGPAPPLQPATPQPGEPAPDAAPDPSPDAPPQPVVVPPVVAELPEAPYPPAALAAGLEADVVLLLTVQVDGSIVDVEVKVPAGRGFDEAALEALSRARFTPATVDGVPTPVRISYTYRFEIAEEVREVEVLPEPEARELVIRGRVLERGTRKALVGVAVILEETGESFVTDAEGRFEVLGPPGRERYTLEVPVDRYEPLIRKVDRGKDGPAEITLRMTRDVYAELRTVVKREKVDKEISRRSIRVQEILKVPGTSGDALKVVELLPGVARASFNPGPPIVRGSSPEDTKVYLEGHLMPALYHFGLYSIINSDLLETVDFWPGGFTSRYGNATGGLLNVTLRDLRTDRWHGSWETNIFHSGFLVEGPVGEDTAVALAARRSYIDAVLPAVVPEDVLTFTVAPRYYDYQARLTHQVSETSRFWLMAYGSDDRIALVLDEPAARGGTIEGIESSSTNHLLTGAWVWDIGPSLRLDSSFRAGIQHFDFATGSAGFDFDVNAWPVDARGELSWEITKAFILTGGVEAGYWPYRIDITAPPPPKEDQEYFADPDPSTFVTQERSGSARFVVPYLEGTLQLSEALMLVPGLRVDAYTDGRTSFATADPRLLLRYTLLEGTTLKALAGLYHQAPQFDETDDVFGNPDLGPERALQVSAGIEQQITAPLKVTVEGYYKALDELVVVTDELTSGVRYLNEGIGRVWGAELMIRHQLTERFFGWLTYSFMVAERRDHPGDDWRPFAFDQTHILNLVGVLRLGRGWEVGTRFRYTTGNPSTPIIGSIYDSDGDGWVPITGEINSDRLSGFHQLDVRFDKKWVYDLWMLNLYLELQNVYNQRNVEAMDHNYDYSEEQPITGLPIIPNFGIKAEW